MKLLLKSAVPSQVVSRSSKPRHCISMNACAFHLSHTHTHYKREREKERVRERERERTKRKKIRIYWSRERERERKGSGEGILCLSFRMITMPYTGNRPLHKIIRIHKENITYEQYVCIWFHIT